MSVFRGIDQMPVRAHSATRRVVAVTAIMMLVLAACDAGPLSTGPAAEEPALSTNPSGPAAETTAPSPGASLPSFDGATDDTELVPAVPEQGEVPPVEQATLRLGGALDLAPSVPLVTGSVDTTGGAIRYAATGDPLDGLTIEVPPGTYAQTVAFEVAARQIAASSFAGITPASPLVSIENGGVVATGGPVHVTIPATIPDEANVLAFYYDATTGSIDPLPVVDRTATAITVAALHFSDIFLALLDLSKVAEAVDSGFRPGVDDWQFTNYGSYAAPGGHCEGQVVSAMWYYLFQRQGGGASPLYGLYDNNGTEGTPTFWPDDSDGYRLASAVQASPIAVPDVYTFARNLGTAGGTFAYNTFRAAIFVTGEPQLMAITDSAGGHGHAIIAYRVAGSRIYVADPNYPGRLRTIKYDPATGVLGPYSSGDSAGSIAANGAVNYSRFALIPKTVSAADGTIAGLWSDFTAGKVGGAAFPAYALEVWTGKDADGNDIWKPLENGYNSPNKELRVRITAPGGETLRLGVYRGTSSKLEKGFGSDLKVDLKEGANELGFYVKGARNGAWRYVDFERLTVNQGLIDINGTWTGTLTFTRITVDEATLKEAEDEGCSIALLQELQGKPLPVTFDITADAEGVGSSTMLLDVSALAADAGEGEEVTAEPLVTDLMYVDGAITFDLAAECGTDATCTMTGVPIRRDDVDWIDGKITMAGTGYSAAVEWSVERD